MLVRQPLLQRRWQQQLLVGFVGKVGLAHQRLPATGLGPSYPQTLANPCFSDGLLAPAGIGLAVGRTIVGGSNWLVPLRQQPV